MIDRLRILHTIRSDGFAGVEQFVLRLAHAQSRAGHVVGVIGGDAGRMGPPLSAAGISHIALPNSAIAVAHEVRVRRHDVDIVNTHMTAADVAGVSALLLNGAAPSIVSTRHFPGPRGRIGPIPIDTLIGRRIDAEISISRAVAASIGRPSTVVHSGVEPVADVTAPRARTVLMAQRLEAEKRTDLGIRAFAAGRLADAGWTLEIAGDGAERPRLEALAADLSVPVRFLGFRADVPALMAGAGMLLAPCTIEGLGLAVIEAMACGLPVVAAAAGGHIEILENLDPRALYAAEDPDAAARSLRSLAGDDPGRAALGSASRERQRVAFSLVTQASGTEAVYRAAIAMRNGS